MSERAFKPGQKFQAPYDFGMGKHALREVSPGQGQQERIGDWVDKNSYVGAGAVSRNVRSPSVKKYTSG
jgi:hypothetical protein